MTLADQLREAVRKDARTSYRVGLDACVDPSLLRRFMGGAGLGQPNVDRLVRHLGFEVRRTESCGTETAAGQ